MSNQVSRRALLAGAGVLTGAGVLSAAPAAAQGRPPRGPSAKAERGGARPATAPALPASISSAPQPGVTYRFVNWHDWLPEDSVVYGRAFGGSGAYTNVTSDRMAAFVDIPPGALLHDVEFYLNNSVDAELHGITWVSGQGSYPSPFWLTETHPANATLHAVQYAVDASVNGPFPHGTRVGVSVPSATDASVQIDGVRFGLTRAPLSTVLLPLPMRVYDTTAGSLTPIKGGQTRTVSLDGHLPVGANGALVALTGFNTVKAGRIRIGAAGTGLAIPALRWGRTGDQAINSATTAVSGAHTIGVTMLGSGASTDLYVDLVGYLV